MAKHSRKSILFVTQFFPSPGSAKQTGGTISNLNFLRAAARDFEVTVLSFDRTSSETDFKTEPFQVVVRQHPAWRTPQLIRHWLNFVRTRVASELADGLNPSALIATTSTFAAFDAAQPTCARIALVQAFENFGFECPWMPFRSRVALAKQAVVRRFQDPRLLRQADAVLTNSRFMKCALVSRFGKDADQIEIMPQLCDVTPREGIAPADTVGFVNRGVNKGFEFVLELARRSPRLRYKIFGHDADLSTKFPPNVEWKGWATDPGRMFASARLWLVPSLWAEPFGRVSIEAQAANRAVLVAGRGGLPETVSDPRFLMKDFNADEWLQRMHELMNCDAEILRRNGALVRSKFSAERHDACIADLISRTIADKDSEADA